MLTKGDTESSLRVEEINLEEAKEECTRKKRSTPQKTGKV